MTWFGGGLGSLGGMVGLDDLLKVFSNPVDSVIQVMVYSENEKANLSLGLFREC